MFKDYLPQEFLTFDSYEDATVVQRILLENGYCVLITREENLWLLNWVWSGNNANRNDVVFGSRDIYEYEYDKFMKSLSKLMN